MGAATTFAEGSDCLQEHRLISDSSHLQCEVDQPNHIMNVTSTPSLPDKFAQQKKDMPVAGDTIAIQQYDEAQQLQNILVRQHGQNDSADAHKSKQLVMAGQAELSVPRVW